MIAFACIDATGRPTGGGMARTLPEGAVLLPRPWTTSDLPRLQYRDGAWVERAVLPAPAPPTEAERLPQARRDGATQINAAAGRARGRIVTDAPGMAQVYAAKRAEAVALIATGAEDLTAFPYLRAEVGLTAATPWQLAQLWLHLSDASAEALARIEAQRRQALDAIATAPDFAAIDAIYQSFTQALGGLSI